MHRQGHVRLQCHSYFDFAPQKKVIQLISAYDVHVSQMIHMRAIVLPLEVRPGTHINVFSILPASHSGLTFRNITKNNGSAFCVTYRYSTLLIRFDKELGYLKAYNQDLTQEFLS